MATKVDVIKNTYPIPSYYYEVKIDGMKPIAFSEIAGLSIEYETVSYQDGLSYKEGVKHMPARAKPVNLTLKKGVVRADSKLFTWISTVKLNTVTKRDITISLKDEKDKPVVSWKVSNAFPKKLDAPSFKADSNDVAIESLELMADKLNLEYH